MTTTEFDIEIVKDATGEFMVVGVEGLTEAGTDFVDAYVTPDPARLYVVDAGHIVIPEDNASALIASAMEQGLRVFDQREDA